MTHFRNPREDDPWCWWLSWLISPSFWKLWTIRHKLEKDKH